MTIRLNSRVIAGNAERVNSDWNSTSGLTQILNKPTNLVHTDGNETISDTKTFNTSPLVPDIATGDNTTKSANTKFVKSSIDTHNTSELAHTFIQTNLSNEITRATGIETGLRNDLNTVTNNVSTITSTTIPNAITYHDTSTSSHQYIQGLVTQEYNERIDDVNDLQVQIDALSASSNVADIVGTYAALMAYDTTKLFDNSIIKVLADETHDDGITYYRWLSRTWNYIGMEAPYYTITESDLRFVPMTRTINTHDLYNNLTLTLADFTDDVGYALDNTVVHKTGNQTESITGNKTFSNNVTITGTLTENSTATFTNGSTNNKEVIVTQTSPYGQFRAIGGNYGFFIRNDGTDTYFLLTNSGDQYGTWNTLRPLAINNSTGNVKANQTWTFGNTIQGTALRAQWADLAEFYLTDEKYPAGTLVQFGGEKEFTIAKTKVNGIISTNPALMMNGELKDGQPIALMGRVPVRVIGKVKKFDKIALSYIDGVGCVSNDSDNVIGVALEDKTMEDEGLVLCSTKLTF